MSSEPEGETWYARARRAIPGGVHSNSRHRHPRPRYYIRAEGCTIWDVDGQAFTDLVMGNGAVVLGHHHPAVSRAVVDAVHRGLGAGWESLSAVRAAEALLELVPPGFQVRLTNTGTEAALHLASMARAATGRPSLAKVEGAYHGWYDPLNVSFLPPPEAAGPEAQPRPVASSGGVDPRWAEDTVILPHNDPEGAEAILRREGDRLAAVFVEPVLVDAGYIPCTREYLERLRAVTAELGIKLVFDELLTGLRLEPGSVALATGIVPDGIMLGKAVGNGAPVAALAAQADWFAVAAPGGRCGFVGTFNGHAWGAAAIEATMEDFRTHPHRAALQKATEQLIAAFAEAARQEGVEAVLQGGGGHFQWYLGTSQVACSRDLWKLDPVAVQAFVGYLTEQGFAVAPGAAAHQAISVAHLPEAVDRLCAAFRPALAQARIARRGD